MTALGRSPGDVWVPVTRLGPIIEGRVVGVVARSGRIVSGIALAGALALGGTLAGGTAAHAVAPVDLAGAYVVDQADVLTDADEQRVEQSLDSLAAESGTNLFVVYVDSFTSPSDRAAWGQATAEQNQLGVNDVLLSVAIDDRLYDLSVADGSSITAADQSALETDVLVPELRDGDWAGAATSLADAIATEGSGSDGDGSTGAATRRGCSGPSGCSPSS